MKIVWDEPKRLANLDKHGFDFAVLDEGFFQSSIIIPAKRNRFMAVGRLANGAVAVIFGRLGTEGISIISMRKAARDERKLLP